MKVIGIDLGTTNTYIYAARKAPASLDSQPEIPRPVLLPGLSDNHGSIATVVMYEDGKPALAGNIAESEYHANKAKQPNRSIASQFKPEIATGESGAMQAMEDFLRILRLALPDDFLEIDSLLYVGIPSLAREDFSINLGACFKNAGWSKPQFLRESDAALISCLQSGVLNIEDIERKCLILDFGGGTCDYTIVESMDALRNGGDPLYGGRLFDDLFFHVFCREDEVFAREAPNSPYAWYLRWVECREQKEKFSDFARESPQNEQAGFTLHVQWYDSEGKRRDTFVPGYSREKFILDAENYQASPQMLEILANYKDRGGLSAYARDLLAQRKTGLISWLRSITESIDFRQQVAKVVLTGGSSRWFFTADIMGQLFKNAQCVPSSRGYEDIAFGLALYPALIASREKTRKLLDKNLEGFIVHAVKKATGIIQAQIDDVIRMCAERIINRDVLPVLDGARKNAVTAAALESQFAENIAGDTGLLAIVEEKSAVLNRQIQDELNFSFCRWLKENGVLLTPVFVFPAKAISNDFLDGLGLRVSNIDSLKMAGFIMANILPALAALAVGGTIAHSGEPVSTIVGGAAAFGSAWLAAKIAPTALKKIKLPTFLLNEKLRHKIVTANRAEIEKKLRKTFAEVQKNMEHDIEHKLRSSLEYMVSQLGILNQIRPIN